MEKVLEILKNKKLMMLIGIGVFIIVLLIIASSKKGYAGVYERDYTGIDGGKVVYSLTLKNNNTCSYKYKNDKDETESIKCDWKQDGDKIILTDIVDKKEYGLYRTDELSMIDKFEAKNECENSIAQYKKFDQSINYECKEIMKTTKIEIDGNVFKLNGVKLKKVK